MSTKEQDYKKTWEKSGSSTYLVCHPDPKNYLKYIPVRGFLPEQAPGHQAEWGMGELQA